MNRPTPLSTATLPVPNLISRSPLRRGLLFIALALCCFALSPAPKAFGALYGPPPDGGYFGNNTAEGTNALFSLTSGINNTAVGFSALLKDTTGGYNVAVGSNALALNTSGSFNMAIGSEALYNNTASANLAIGFRVLYFNTTGNNLTGIGAGALYNNTTGSFNTAAGAAALSSNTTGANNTAVGRQALYSNTTGSNNIALGASAGFFTTGSGNIDIGAAGVAGESSTTRIGNIGSTLQNSGLVVTVDAVGGTKLGYSSPSSRRYKDEIKAMDKASEAILALKPVSFRYKKEFDPTHGPGYGLIAEDVEKVNPDLVSHNDKGEVMTVRYEAVNAMLLNEFLKEHRKMQEQEASITQLKSTVAQQQKDFQATAAQQQKEIKALTASLKEQASQIQRVSAQVEMSHLTPQMVLNNQ